MINNSIMLAATAATGGNFESGVQILLTFLLAIVIITAISIAAKFVYVYIDKIQSQITSSDIDADFNLSQQALFAATEIIRDVVKSFEVTVKKELLEKSADGKLTKEEGKVILDTAIETIKAQFSGEIFDGISLIINDIDSWITTKIEVCLEEIKAEKNDEGVTLNTTPNAHIKLL